LNFLVSTRLNILLFIKINCTENSIPGQVETENLNNIGDVVSEIFFKMKMIKSTRLDFNMKKKKLVHY
jgi:hypothetical protein